MEVQEEEAAAVDGLLLISEAVDSRPQTKKHKTKGSLQVEHMSGWRDDGAVCGVHQQIVFAEKSQRRQKLPKAAQAVLDTWISEHQSLPYPSRA